MLELPFLSESDFMILQNGAQTLSAQAPFQSVFQRFLTQAARQRALELVAPLKDQGAQLVAFDRDHSASEDQAAPAQPFA